MSKPRLYIDTVLHLKISQVAYRVWRKFGGKTCLRAGFKPCPDVSGADIDRMPTMPELDFDPVFLARFDVDAILDDRIELLHHEENVNWRDSWQAELSTPLWRFNLHYHEYLLPLAKHYIDTRDDRYLNKAKDIVDDWIEFCPRDFGGAAWDPYVISMRVVNWLAFRAELKDALKIDDGFCARMDASLAEQYVFLSQHLEKDLLANHYLENLKAIVILACYYADSRTLKMSLPLLQAQVDEQVLSDGMHFELSPMYQKIVLEDLMRIAETLRICGHGDYSEKFKLQQMVDCLYSMERGINRTPLFNDCGDNVAKSRDALIGCALLRFGINPEFHNLLSESGYCIFERRTPSGFVKLIFDGGNPGPSYALGHAHCDALSFECFVNGDPWIVNCGTYAYQDEKRLEFKNTRAHNTVLVSDKEMHECWAPFRIARFSKCKLLSVNISEELDTVKAELTTIDGNLVYRSLCIDDSGILIHDSANIEATIISFLHFATRVPPLNFNACKSSYAPDFGTQKLIDSFVVNLQSIYIPFNTGDYHA